MGIAPVVPVDRDLTAEQHRDIERFEVAIAQYLAGEISEDVFRVMRLNNGIYGQRQGGTNQMVRVKLPAGTITPEQFDTMAYLVETYSRGWGHITTRQNVQMHYVELTKIPEVMRHLAKVGLTSREACGDTVRNVMACHLAGACPHEVLDVTPWAEAAFRHFVRNPLGQRLPRKFKINFSGCSSDCGQAMFNDAGVVATTRTREDGTVESGFRVYIAGGLGATPHPAMALEDFTSREDLLPTIEAVLRVFEQTGNRDNKLRARMKWVVDTLGIDEVRRRVLKVRHTLPASSTWPGGIPEVVAKAGDAPAGLSKTEVATAVGQGGASSCPRPTRTSGGWPPASSAAWPTAPCRRWPTPRWATSRPSSSAPSPPSSASSPPTCASRTVRTWCSAACRRPSCPCCTPASRRSAWPGPVPSSPATSWPAPAPTRATSPSPSRAAWPRPSASGSRKRASARSVACASTSRAARTRAASTTPPTSASSVPSAAPTAAAPPATRCCSAATSARSRSTSATRPCACRRRTAPEAAARVIRRFAHERNAGEEFRSWMDRMGGASAIALELKDLDHFPSPEEAPEFYADYDETGPFSAEVGDSECAV